MWENLINKKQYIGSSENLKKRFQQYFNTNHLIKDNCMKICRALLKYDYSNFSLTIIEYCSPDKCIEREKYYINFFGSEYNTIKDPTLPQMSGRTHSDKTKTKISDTKQGTNVSDKTKQIMSDIKKGSNHPMFGKNHTEETKQIISDAMIGNTNKKGKPRAEGAGKPSQAIEVTDIKNNITTSYNSISEAARALNINNNKAISNYIKNNQKKPYKGIYTFKKV